MSNTESNNIYEPESSEPTHSTRDMAVQVTSGDIFIKFLSMIYTQPKLETLTDIPTFKLLNKICEFFSTNFPDKWIHNAKEHVILVFAKLKQDFSFAILAILLKKYSRLFL